ncbi:MAG: DJ-1/PfpI family protein [Rhodospirillales bacterium]
MPSPVRATARRRPTWPIASSGSGWRSSPPTGSRTRRSCIRTDLRNAGAIVVDREVVVDKGLVTSRWPDDMPIVSAKLIDEIGEGRQRRGAE